MCVEEVQANARLIAAAPELLAAVQAYDKARADAVAKTFDNDDETSLAVAILSAEADHRVGHLMMAALRKAEGK
jgi:siroheme synthase (precorrin-2 oxidase/ferrochelatase)